MPVAILVNINLHRKDILHDFSLDICPPSNTFIDLTKRIQKYKK